MFRKPNKNHTAPTEVEKCENEMARLEVIAGATCRLNAARIFMDSDDGFIWSDKVCEDTSKSLIEKAKQCSSLQKKGPGG
jgi:hypothetical protein